MSEFDKSFWESLNNLQNGDEWSKISDLHKQALARPINANELEVILRNYAFLELCDASIAQPTSVDPNNVRFVQSKSGWMIHDHGSVLRASPGRWLYQLHDATGASGGVGYGTAVQQFVDTTRDMLAIAQNRWQYGARVLAGYRPMQFAAYLIAQASAYSLEGLALSKQEELKYNYVKDHVKALAKEAPEPDRMPR